MSTAKPTKPKKDDKASTNRYTHSNTGKLAFYCDACKKQCGDKLGYERHCQSAAHNERMQWISENQEQYTQENSNAFEKVYLDLLKLRGNNPVEMNVLYQDVLHDKNHIHLKATRWQQLQDFVRYLGETNKCQVDFVTNKGWMLTYVEQDEKILAKTKFAAAKRSLISNAITSQQQEYIKQRELAQNFSFFSPSPDETGQEIEHKPISQESKIPTDLTSLSSTAMMKLGNKSRTTKRGVFDDDDDDDDDNNNNDDDSDDDDDGAVLSSEIDPQMNIINNNVKNDQMNRDQETTPALKRKEMSELPSTTTTTATITTTSSTSNSTQNSSTTSKKLRKPDPWIRKGLLAKITNQSLEDGRAYGCKGPIVEIYTSINKQLIPIDLSLKSKLLQTNINSATAATPSDATIPTTTTAAEDEGCNDDDEEEEEEVIFPHPNNPTQQVCIDYSLCLVAEVVAQVPTADYLAYLQGHAASCPPEPHSIEKRFRLPQTQLQTTLPRQDEFDRAKKGGRDLLIALVAGKYADVESDQPKRVKLLSLDASKELAQVQLVDESFKDVNDDLVQLNGAIRSEHREPSFFNSIVSVSYDDICKFAP